MKNFILKHLNWFVSIPLIIILNILMIIGINMISLGDMAYRIILMVGGFIIAFVSVIIGDTLKYKFNNKNKENIK